MSEQEKRELQQKLEELRLALTISHNGGDTLQPRDYADAAYIARDIARFIEERVPEAK